MEVFGMEILQGFQGFYTKKILVLVEGEAQNLQQVVTQRVIKKRIYITNINQEEEA